MIPSPPPADRRNEERHRTLTAQSTAWNGPWSPTVTQRGWIYDVSSSGMALLVEPELAPEIGQTIQVHLSAGSEPVAFDVVRIESGGGSLLVIGCERGAGGQAMLGTDDRFASARRAA